MIELLKFIWKEFKIQTYIAAVVVSVVYLAYVSDSYLHPWTLWKQEARGNWEQRRVSSYRDQKFCLEAQAKALKEELETRQKVNGGVARPNDPFPVEAVFITEGSTIFEYRKSFLSSLGVKSLPPEMQTEIASTVSFFCTQSTIFYGLWPYYYPTFDAASIDLKRLGEHTLSLQARQMLGE
jgi:hypothetical protein